MGGNHEVITQTDKACLPKQDQGTAPSPLLTQEVKRTLEKLAKLHPTSVWNDTYRLSAAMKALTLSAQHFQYFQL